MSTKKWIELGDIIELVSPEWNEKIFFVSYIDKSILELIDIQTVLPHLFPLSPINGNFEDKTIEKVKVLSRSSVKGYARQNGLLKHKWIDIFFGGDVPKSITAEITNLEEDMIELTTYPENKILYIDFAYQGIPRNIPLKNICIRDKPASFHRGEYVEEKGDDIDLDLDKEIPDETYEERLQKIYKLQELEEDEELREVIQQIEIPPEQKQFGIDAQVNDLLDAFLSTIPDYNRTPSVMNNIYTHIQRFKELRENYSIYDTIYYQITGVKRVDTQPLVQKLYNINTSLLWCIPVVSQTKNIYTAEDENISKPTEDVNMIDMEIDANNEIEDENRLFYKNNMPDENTVKYANMYIENADYMSPFIITDFNQENTLHTLSKISTDIDVIISSNLDRPLYSSVVNQDNDKLSKKKFVMERYNTEIQYPYKKNAKSKESSLFATLFPSDKFAFHSLFTLPNPFILFSKIKLPNTNILKKTLLHQKYPYYFQYLNKKTPVREKMVQLNVDTANISFNQYQHFMLSNMDDTAQSLNSQDKLMLFLKKTVPTLQSLVNDYLQTQKQIFYTFLDAVDILEPFGIYFENMNVEITNTIKRLLYKHIDNYKTNNSIQTGLFKSLLLEKYKLEFQKNTNALTFLLEENKEQQKKCIDNYTYDIENSTASEWLQYISTLDQSKLYLLYLRLIDTELHTPEDLLGITEEEGGEAEKGKTPCWKRVITKKYYSISELREDNNKPVIVDKEYDTTDYGLIETLKKEQPELYDEKKETEFVEFVAENLINKYHYERDHAYKTARNMVAKERMVEEDEYAILENIPKLSPIYDEETLSEKEKSEIQIESETKKRIMYFIRKKNVWVHIPELDELSFVDNNTLICNIDEKCISSKKKCQDVNQTLNQFRKDDLEKMRNEFKNRYTISIEEKKQQIELELNKHEIWIKEHLKLRENNKSYMDIQCYARGTKAVLQEFIMSPYVELRDNILAKNVDFVTKQHYILLFVEKYCREPMIDEPMSENVHWLYCKETNTKLMPRSLFLLAKGFKENNYKAVLDKLCNTIGKLSDDGDAYIDKYSGYILKKIEFREEGFEITNEEEEEGLWENVEKSFENIVIRENKKRTIERIFVNEIDQKIYNIISAICSNIHLENDNLKENMIQLCQEWLQISTLFPSEKIYKINYEKRLEKRKQNPKLVMPDDYKTYNEKLYIIIAAISVLVIIQTTIPTIQIKKSFSRCIKSFYGYPLKEGQDDLTSIKYLVCVLKEMYAQNKEGKKLISKNETVVETNMIEILKKYVLLTPKVMHLYDLKRKDMLINQIVEDEVDSTMNVQNKWQHFLPPIIPFNIEARELQTISPSTSKKQEVLNIFVVKTRLLSISLIEKMREFIEKQNLLFQTKSGFPYLQNACCLGEPSTSVLNYFQEQDHIIDKTLKIILNNANQIALLKQKRKAIVLLKENPKNENELELDKKIQKQNIFMTFEPSIYYSIAIHYCKLESEIYPIPEDLQGICPNKPSNMTEDYYDKNMSMVEKIDYLSKHQLKMDAIKSIELMNIVNKRNFVVLNTPLDVSPIQKFQNAIEEFQELNIDLDLVTKHMKKWITSDYTIIPSNKQTIISFIRRNGSKKFKDNIIEQKMSVLYNWENYKLIPVSNILQTMKSMIRLFGIIYPSYLCSKFSDKINIPKHWELIETDELFLKNELQNYKTKLIDYQIDILIPIFKNINERIQPLITMLEYYKEEEEEDNDKKKQIYDFAIFCLEFVFLIYIELINNRDIYKKISDKIMDKKHDKKRETQMQIDTNSQLVLDLEDEDIVEEEIDFSTDYLNDVKQKIADYLLAIISTIKTKEQVNQKEAFMLTYDEIISKMDYYRDREKQKIKNYFKRMPVEERKPEIELKKLRLGVFAIDNKKLTTYGKETGFYDNVFDKKDLMEDLETIEDLGEKEEEDNIIYANEQDEDDNLNIQQNEDDYEDMNDNVYEDYYESEYN